MSQLTDSEIIEKVLGGERDLFHLLVTRHQVSLLKYLRGFQPRRELVEELAQEVFVQAYFKLSSFSPERARFSTWIFTIARNKCFTDLKSVRRRGEEPLNLDREFIDDSTPLHAMQTLQDDKFFYAALARLPDQFKSAVLLFFVNDLKLNEIASIENCSIGTVKSRIFRGKQLLRTDLERNEFL